jgi:hypothetical protein
MSAFEGHGLRCEIFPLMTQSGRRGYSLNEARLNRYDALSLLSVGRTFEFRRFPLSVPRDVILQ